MIRRPALLCALLLGAAAASGCATPQAPVASRDATPVAAAADPYAAENYVQLTHPEWSKNTSIYQINTRQFTAQGSLRAAAAELPRLKALGVDILWLMPIHPIGRVNRKGSLGSPYAVQDYFAVNPELGTLEDLRAFVDAAHRLDLYVILDWVANHTAWDNPLVAEHPDWYKRDPKGRMRPTPWWDWTDIIELDFTQRGTREYMARALRYWVEQADIDGYRCDVAGFVPLDFWNQARRELDAIKPVFMLAEWESRDLHANAFDMTYAWSWWDHMHRIAQGKADVNALHGYYSWNENFYPKDAYRMTFVSNHDKNSWEGTEFESFGPMLDGAIALSVIGEGMPLIYNGQEAGNSKRLAFFERDPIAWREHPQGALYRSLLALRKRTTALWNGRWGATMIHIPNSAQKQVLSFVRRNAQGGVFAVFNFSAQAVSVGFDSDLHYGNYTQHADGTPIVVDANTTLTLAPWAWRVMIADAATTP